VSADPKHLKWKIFLHGRTKVSIKTKKSKNCLTRKEEVIRMPAYSGVIAQLGERLHGMQEVGGSIPPSSTININDVDGKNV